MKYGLYELEDFKKVYSEDIVQKCVNAHSGNKEKARDFLQVCHDLSVDPQITLGEQIG